MILGANTLYMMLCLFKEIPMASKGLLREHGRYTTLTRNAHAHILPRACRLRPLVHALYTDYVRSQARRARLPTNDGSDIPKRD